MGQNARLRQQSHTSSDASISKMPMKPRPQKKERPAPKKRTVAPLPPPLPRVKLLPRELLPVISKTNMKENLDNEFVEFRNINEHLPSLKKVNGSIMIQNLYSPIEHFTISGESSSYFVDLHAKLFGEEAEKDLALFVKRVHLVEPIQAMEGVYRFPADGALPQEAEGWQNTLTKIHSEYNEAYIDTLCGATLSRLVELEMSPHWIRFYGTFNARAQSYMYNITGEISTLRHEKWFKKNEEAGLFSIRVVGEEPSRPTVEMVDDDDGSVHSMLDCDRLGDEKSHAESDACKSHAESDECKSETPSTDDEAPVAVVAAPAVRIVKLDNNSICEDESEDDESETSSQHQCEYYAEFEDFPVQVTLLERCEGTMDALLDIEETSTDTELAKTKDARWSAWLTQVMSALTVAQYYYGLVHNDLHTNNIMWTTTDEPYLYYKLVGATSTKFYRVPTYGRLMKIIDFGRASFWLSNREDLLITDSYAPDNDAADQYNCPPYYDDTQPRVDPSPSFDLCRLAVSMFDAVYPEQPPTKEPQVVMAKERGRITYETESPLYNILWKWLTDDEGKSIMRKPDDSERFPDFDLYKHIARHAKNSVPREEIQAAYFAGLYTIDSPPDNVKVWTVPLQ